MSVIGDNLPNLEAKAKLKPAAGSKATAQRRHLHELARRRRHGAAKVAVANKVLDAQSTRPSGPVES